MCKSVKQSPDAQPYLPHPHQTSAWTKSRLPVPCALLWACWPHVLFPQQEPYTEAYCRHSSIIQTTFLLLSEPLSLLSLYCFKATSQQGAKEPALAIAGKNQTLRLLATPLQGKQHTVTPLKAAAGAAA